jgi:hypothetical protein
MAHQLSVVQEQMKNRVETSAAFAKLVTEKSRSFLGNIIYVDKSAASFHSPETKLSPRNGLKKANHATKEKV